jgi:hypothetical protein
MSAKTVFKYVRYLAIWVVLLALLGALCWMFLTYREEECAQTCLAQGKKGYQYQGFTGYGRRSLRADVCTCLP